PLTTETKSLIGKREVQLRKKSAIFINSSLSQSVIEYDILEALLNDDIAAIGLNVFEKETIDPNHPLLQMKHVVTTPHIGSSTRATERKMSELAAFNLEEGLNGRNPPHLIDPAVWQTIQMHRG